MTDDSKNIALPAQSWASALMDGETSFDERVNAANPSTSEQLFYYSVTRQVVRGESCYETRNIDRRWGRIQWARFWAQVETRQQDTI